MKRKITLWAFVCGCVALAPAWASKGTESFTMADFASVEKVDIHVHINTSDTALIDQAAADHFRLLTINVDYPDFPPLSEQRRVAHALVAAHPERVAFAAAFSMQGWDEPGWQQHVIQELDSEFAQGAVAVKVWKNIGMEFRDAHGKLVMIDDPKFDPVFEFIRQRDKVLIGHQGEPRNCWLPVADMSVNNDKEYFQEHPQYHMFLHPEMPSYEDQMAARDRMLDRNPQIKFMGAHMASLEWSVDRLAAFLDRYPNTVVDLAARMGQVEFQSNQDREKVRRFFIRYQDRLLYGTDTAQNAEDKSQQLRQEAHENWLRDWRYLNTDQTFKVPELDAPVHGLGLPRDVVRKVYSANAERWYGNPWHASEAHSTSRGVAQAIGSVEGKSLTVTVFSDGAYSIASSGITGAVIRSDVEAEVGAHVLRSADFPQHRIVQSEFQDEFGAGSALTVTNTGLPGAPDLIYVVKLFRDQAWGEIEVKVRNTTDQAISVQAIRAVHATDAPFINLNGPVSADRILSDSYSEDRPQLAIRELGDAPKGLHRAVGSQLIYNRQSGQSLFFGALTSDRLLTIFHLKEQTAGARTAILSYEAVATGTTEIMKGESLKDSPPSEQVNLSIRVNSGNSLSSERLMFAVGSDYHAQLEQYGRVVGVLHKARVNAPTPIGWWSWTAYYFGLNQGTAATNAYWLAENLKQMGYTYYQIDEGYQYARGEYTTADVKLFPSGIGYIADLVRHSGLTFGLWTAPFEVSERAWVFQNHKEWLLHNAAGQLIHIGYVTDKQDALYVLDTTNPGAQNYLRETYSTLRNWGLRFVKMDFMDDTAVEGAYYRPNTSALEAQRIGLKVIREAVGESVILDKDGSPMLNPVGIVDAGRISQDTGHSFDASRDAASGIAARYYMNRNYFIADPDAFTVSTQTVDDQSWHGGKRPLSLDEAKVSIALAAVSGGMFELGDDLPTLGSSAERLALAKNTDLIDMARLGRSSTPIDLMSYAPADRQPSIFLLKENAHQSILTLFNWTDAERTRTVNLASLGLKDPGKYQMVEVFGEPGCCSNSSDSVTVVQKAHSVRVLKLIDNAVPAPPPAFEVRSANGAKAGETLNLSAVASSPEAPVLTCHWDFGDGTSTDGLEVHHAFTHGGEYDVQVTVTGLGAVTQRKTSRISITGDVSTRFDQEAKQRAVVPQ